MKKYFMLFAAAAAAFCLASCSKSAIDNTTDGIILNIKVADLNGPATKAVKTGWASGDKINVWYDLNVSEDPDLVIVYDGKDWIIDESATLSGKLPDAEGKIKYLFEGYNDLSSYSSYNWGMQTFRGTANLVFAQDYYKPVYYTYSGNVLKFEISNWVPMSGIQVVVTGIAPEDYQLKCDRLQMFSEINIYPEETALTNVGYDEYTDGVANEDGTAFYFSTTDSAGTAADYTFTIKNSIGFEYSYTVTGKTIANGKFTAIKIPVSKFKY